MFDFTNLKVLVIGDICLDIIESGTASRLSPEAPVPVVLNPIKTYSAGMAGNVAINLANLGAEVYLEGFISTDENGLILSKLLEDANVKFIDDKVYYEEGSRPPTTTKKRILANNHQIARIDIEKNGRCHGAKVASNLSSRFSTDFFDMIIISDYNKGVISKDSWEHLSPVLNDINKGLFFVDTKKKNILDYYRDCILFPNTKELNEIVTHYHEKVTQDNLFKILEDLYDGFIVETQSELGSTAHFDYQCNTSSAIQSEVIDITGAGDTFIASFALYYSLSKNVQKSMDFANYCCSKVVMKKGTAPIEYREAVSFDYTSKY
jgi:rfaE bifunctional protein kinase chain/domain